MHKQSLLRKRSESDQSPDTRAADAALGDILHIKRGSEVMVAPITGILLHSELDPPFKKLAKVWLNGEPHAPDDMCVYSGREIPSQPLSLVGKAKAKVKG